MYFLKPYDYLCVIQVIATCNIIVLKLQIWYNRLGHVHRGGNFAMGG